MTGIMYKYDAFLSYARADLEYAERLDNTLQACGLKVWRDVRDIDPALDFTAEIEMAIKASRAVVVSLTKDIERIDSFVRREIGYTISLNARLRKEGTPVKPIYIVAQDDALPPVHVANCIQFRPHEDANALSRLCAILQGAMPTHSTPYLSFDNVKMQDDPFRESLQNVYEEIVVFLNAAVPTIIDLHSREVHDVVEKRRVPNMVSHIRDMTMREGLQITSEPVMQIKIFSNICEALQRYGHRLLLLGAPGSGKTVTLFAAARDAIAIRLSDPNAPLPLLADIASWDGNVDGDDSEHFANWISNLYDVNVDLLRPLMGTKNAFLFLDGLDELDGKRKDEHGYEHDLCALFLEALPNTMPILLSSREEDYQQLGKRARLNGAVILEPLDDAQIKAYFWNDHDIWDVLQCFNDLLEIFRIPLFLRFLREAFAHEGQEIRMQLSEMESITESHFGDDYDYYLYKHARRADIRGTFFNYYINKAYWREVGRMAQTSSQTVTIDLKLFNDALSWAAMLDYAKPDNNNRLYRNYFPINDDVWEYFISLAENLHLLVFIGDSRWRFLHLELYDYFIRKSMFLRESMLSNAPCIYDNFISESINHLALGQQKSFFTSFLVPLDDNNEYIRGRFAEALGLSKERRFVKPLVALLNDTTRFRKGLYYIRTFKEVLGVERVCDVAVWALKNIGTKKALAAVKVWMNNDIGQ